MTQIEQAWSLSNSELKNFADGMEKLVEGYLFGGFFKERLASEIMLGYQNPITDAWNDKMGS